ncbi:uncharacterized protein LOC131144655 [Malania oleifera]|uniref:uncharacterized protein LOC131144655 n=1 Tax=Malania oleifera TaxID=397392 RepID=UPI0025AE9E6A|nr:uncharacterized protein LOC131144655 [Malania oleifera]XP_057949413.1 uncharacterized protein LOC131144655 [Malania oleifera]
MDPLADEQLDYEDEEYGGAQKMQFQGGGAISALADDELMGEDEEYDDLYNDVNVGEGFLQLHRPEAPVPPVGVNGEVQAQKTDVPEPRLEAGGSQGPSVPGVKIDGKYSLPGGPYPEQQKDGLTAVTRLEMGSVDYRDGASVSQKGKVLEMTHDAQVRNISLHGSVPVPQKAGIGPTNMSTKSASEPVPLLNTGAAGSRGVPQLPTNQMGTNVNMNRPVANENSIQPAVENGGTMLFVGELHWWTTDAELESVLSQYGRVKEIKFFDERASGKSKGYCQVEFYDLAAAAACKERMNGHVFNGRACVVAFASPQTLKQMGASYLSKTQGQTQSQSQGRRPMNDGAGRGGGMNYSGGDAGRNYGRGGWGRGGQGILNRGPGGGPMRGRGAMGAKNMVGNAVGVGSGASGGGYGQGIAGPAFGGPSGGLMHPQSMMGAGFDPTYMGRGGGYGGFSGPAFPGMLPSFPAVNTMGLAGVAPHVNPAFFGRGMVANGMGMMGTTGMDGHQAGMWTETSMGGWGGEEHGRRTRESSYGGDDGASEYGYGDVNHEKGVRSNAVSRERDRGSEREWSGNSDRRYRDDREQDWDRSDREHRYREEKDGYRDHRQRERDLGNDDDWDRGQSSSRSRSRSRMVPEEDHRSRSRDVEYGKRRRLPSE